MTSPAFDKTPRDGDKAEMKETSDMAAKRKRRMPLIPFTRSWREDRKARKESPEIMDVKNREAAKEVEVSPPQTVPIKLTMSNAVMKTQTATESHSRKEKIEKVLEQYGQHDNKGIVGWDAPVSCVLRIELVCIAPGHSGIAIVPLRRSLLRPITTRQRSP